ncbi:MAG: hypothetical protein IJS59_08295, partial [Bacteroidaceae bacterium]|nr:hypothetical protein [Bacteroidaceae bacterium]
SFSLSLSYLYRIWRKGTTFLADGQIKTLAYAVMYGLWGAATEKSGCARTTIILPCTSSELMISFAIHILLEGDI